VPSALTTPCRDRRARSRRALDLDEAARGIGVARREDTQRRRGLEHVEQPARDVAVQVHTTGWLARTAEEHGQLPSSKHTPVGRAPAQARLEAQPGEDGLQPMFERQVHIAGDELAAEPAPGRLDLAQPAGSGENRAGPPPGELRVGARAPAPGWAAGLIDQASRGWRLADATALHHAGGSGCGPLPHRSERAPAADGPSGRPGCRACTPGSARDARAAARAQ
jgi:hypothetical protein